MRIATPREFGGLVNSNPPGRPVVYFEGYFVYNCPSTAAFRLSMSVLYLEQAKMIIPYQRKVRADFYIYCFVKRFSAEGRIPPYIGKTLLEISGMKRQDFDKALYYLAEREMIYRPWKLKDQMV